MYLRFGWVVGNVGLLGTLLIVTLATCITFLTALSIASIATDQNVKTGGAYYMISRSLGIESGGAIGISLYFAQAFSVALYTVGFAESVVQVFPQFDERLLGIVVTVLITFLALGSAKAAIRAQYIIMIGIALSLLSLIFGTSIEQSDVPTWGSTLQEPAGFWVVFAVFFPAVTGIMAGVNMSGDLKDAKKAIPKGTFAAVGVGYLIYMALPILLAARVSTESLVSDPLVMREIAYWGDAILIGVWGATLSSAVGSILGAPRVLQALAKDDILPKFLKWTGKGAGKEDTPRLGTLLTLGIVLLAVYFGDLNLIAPVLTMFFLTTYGVLNIAAGTERFLGSPSFRPTFKVHWIFSLLGAVSCFAVMVLINAPATLVAILFVALIYIWLKRRQLQSSFGNIGRGVRMAIIRSVVMKLGEEKDTKNWRPNPMVLAGTPTKRWHLIEFANNFTARQGLLTVATVLPEGSMNIQQIQSMREHIKDFMSKRGVQGLVKVFTSKDRFKGTIDLVSAYGFEGLQPNTIILGESDEEENQGDFCDMIRRFYLMNRNVLIVHRSSSEEVFGKHKSIHVWWGGLKGNGGFMMILAFLLSRSLQWRNATVYINMVVENNNALKSAYENLNAKLSEIRIEAETNIIAANGRSFEEILQNTSEKADLIFMGMAKPKNEYAKYYNAINKRIKNLPTTILCLAAEEVAFGDVLIKDQSEAE